MNNNTPPVAQRELKKSNAKADAGLPFDVAIDDGLAQMKLVGEQTCGEYLAVKFPTGIKPAGAGAVVDLSGSTIGMYETEEGETYVVTSTTNSEETRFPEFHVSQIDRVLVHHALIQAGYDGQKVTLYTSLPVDEYFTGATRNSERIDRKIKNLKKKVGALASDATPTDIIDVRVGCQGIAAYFDYLYGQAGEKTADVPESMCVIDIGGSTTDIAVIVGGKSVDFASTGAARVGVLDVHTAVQAMLSKELGTQIRVSPKQIDDACRSRTIKVFGQQRDISAIVDAAVRDVGSTIRREITRKIGSGATLSTVLCVGGGASMFKSVIADWPHAVIPADPDFANARGLLKYARSKRR